MLEINNIRENKESIIGQLKIRNKDFEKLIVEIINLDELRRSAQFKLDNELAELNQLSKKIGELFKTGQHQQANELKQKTALLKDSTKTLKQQLVDSENSIKEILYQIPNVPNKLVPYGNSENDNEVIENYGNTPQLFAGAIPHWEIAKKYNLIDFELGVKITGSGFPVYIGKGAQLQRALINFFLNEAIASNYKEVIPPLVVNEESGFATGQLPDKEGQMYQTVEDGLYAIPTAEVPLTNFLRDEILSGSDLPIYRCAYSACFRREAGSYGKEVRGLNRVHQFDKVEILKWVKPETSFEELESLREYAEGLLQVLGLPYRTLLMCGGDMGFSQTKQYDLEVWAIGQQKWLEVSSCSNFECVKRSCKRSNGLFQRRLI